MYVIMLYSIQVEVKTITPDFSALEIIRMIGAKEERVAMKQGPDGKIIGEFADGSEVIDYSNLLLFKRPACAPQAIQKKPAAACKKQPAAASHADDGESDSYALYDDTEEDESEVKKQDEEEEEEEVADEVPADAFPEPPAVPEDCFDSIAIELKLFICVYIACMPA